MKGDDTPYKVKYDLIKITINPSTKNQKPLFLTGLMRYADINVTRWYAKPIEREFEEAVSKVFD